MPVRNQGIRCLGSPRRFLRVRPIHLLPLGLALMVVLAVALVRGSLLGLEVVSYLTIFVLSLAGSGGMILPVPSLAAVCTGPSLFGLSPILVALVATTAESLGEFVGYGAGYSGGLFFQRRRIFQVICDWMQRRGGLALFLFAVIPNPFFDVVGVAAGGLRYPIHRFFAVIWVAKLVKTLIVAYACGYGLEAVVDALT